MQSPVDVVVLPKNTPASLCPQVIRKGTMCVEGKRCADTLGINRRDLWGEEREGLGNETSWKKIGNKPKVMRNSAFKMLCKNHLTLI